MTNYTMVWENYINKLVVNWIFVAAKSNDLRSGEERPFHSAAFTRHRGRRTVPRATTPTGKRTRWRPTLQSVREPCLRGHTGAAASQPHVIEGWQLGRVIIYSWLVKPNHGIVLHYTTKVENGSNEWLLVSYRVVNVALFGELRTQVCYLVSGTKELTE